MTEKLTLKSAPYPEEVNHRGGLQVSGAGLREIPASWRFNGYLCIACAPDFKRFESPSLSIMGSLMMNSLDSLKQLVLKRVSTTGDICISNMDQLETIEIDEVNCSGELRIWQCGRLTTIKGSFVVLESVRIVYCDSLETLEELVVRTQKSVIIDTCEKLKHCISPESMINQTLEIIEIGAMETLTLCDMKDLKCRSMSKLKSIESSNKKELHNFVVENCAKLSRISENIGCRGKLCLKELPMLDAVPEASCRNIETLYLIDLPELEKFPLGAKWFWRCSLGNIPKVRFDKPLNVTQEMNLGSGVVLPDGCRFWSLILRSCYGMTWPRDMVVTNSIWMCDKTDSWFREDFVGRLPRWPVEFGKVNAYHKEFFIQMKHRNKLLKNIVFQGLVASLCHRSNAPIAKLFPRELKVRLLKCVV